MSQKDITAAQELVVLRDLVRECEKERDRAQSERDGHRIALQAAEAKISSMEAIHQRMLGWQDCAREVMRRQGNPQMISIADRPPLSDLLKGPLS